MPDLEIRDHIHRMTRRLSSQRSCHQICHLRCFQICALGFRDPAEDQLRTFPDGANGIDSHGSSGLHSNEGKDEGKNDSEDRILDGDIKLYFQENTAQRDGEGKSDTPCLFKISK